MLEKPLKIALVVGPNCELESIALRNSLEYFGAIVTTFWIGRPNDLIQVLSGTDASSNSDFIILNFHGEEGEFLLPELGEDVYEDDEPKQTSWGISEIKQYVNVKANVIASGCTLGTTELGTTFLRKGATSYIAPSDYIDGNSSLMFLIQFFYHIINHGKSIEEACLLARKIDEDTQLYQFYD